MLGILDKLEAFANLPDGRALRHIITPIGIYNIFILLDNVL